MIPPRAEDGPLEHLEWLCWRQMHGRASEVGEESYRLLVRLVVRYWPASSLERLRVDGHWAGAKRKRYGQVLVARVREEFEARRPGDERWDIILAGTVRMVWDVLCHRWYHDEQTRRDMRAISSRMAETGVEPL